MLGRQERSHDAGTTSSSPVVHTGIALLDEGARPLLEVGVIPVHAEQRPAVLEGVRVAHLDRAPHGLHRQRNGCRRVLADLLGDLLGDLEQPVRWRQLVDEPELVGALGRHPVVPPAERQPQRRTERQPLRQADVLDRADHPDVGVGVDEGRLVGCDDDVGIDDEVEAGAGDESVDGTDRRLPHVVLARRPVNLLVQRSLARLHGSPRRHRPEVGAGAEVSLAGAGDDRAADPRVFANLGPDRLERLDHAGVEGVAAVGPIDPDVGDVVRASRRPIPPAGR